MSVLKTYGETSQDGLKPSKTFRMTGDHIEGIIDGLAAVQQAAQLCLATERFAHSIYSYDYGLESAGLIGKRRAIVEADLERRITEALLEDDRITGVEDFSLSFERDSVVAKFRVTSLAGDFSMEKGVDILGQRI